MIFARYNYPLPNNGTGYSFSEQELVKLLDSVYEQGYTHGVESTIQPETITACYDDLSVTFPVTDPDHMWNKNNDSSYTWSPVMEQAVNEIRLLENVLRVDKYSDDTYNSFRKEVCVSCSDPNCLRSQCEIYDCHKFENYYEV